jgi:hypothetical protein
MREVVPRFGEREQRRPHLSRDDPRRIEVAVFLQTEPTPPPNSGKADTLDEAKADFKARYAEVKGK